jgi:1-phosphofructokinase family hexose kinase
MILTVTANAALDRVIFIDAFQPTTSMLASHWMHSVGGKGFDSSVVLQALGVPTLALGFVAGQVGKQLAQLLENYGIPTDLVWVDGETRIAHVLVETEHQRHSHIITPGYQIDSQAREEILRRYVQHLPEAAWVIAAGSLPSGLEAGFYGELATLANQVQVKTLFDCSGETMRRCLTAGPSVVKMNRSEFVATFQMSVDTEAQLIGAVQRVREANRLPAIVVTCGSDGLLAATTDGTFIASSPPQNAVNAAGAGDAVSAVLAWCLEKGDPWSEALRWGAAAGGAVVLTPGTADCRLEDVERITKLTTVRSV